MSLRTGSHSPAGSGKSLPELGLLLLLVFVFLEGSVLPLGVAGSLNENDSHGPKAHNATPPTKKPFPVLSFEYSHIKTPFEISLWVLLASLMKLGEYILTFPVFKLDRYEFSLFWKYLFGF